MHVWNTTALCATVTDEACTTTKSSDSCVMQLADIQLAKDAVEERAWRAMLRARSHKRRSARLAAITVTCIVGGKQALGTERDTWRQGQAVMAGCHLDLISHVLAGALHTVPLCTFLLPWPAGLLLAAVVVTLRLRHRCV